MVKKVTQFNSLKINVYFFFFDGNFFEIRFEMNRDKLDDEFGKIQMLWNKMERERWIDLFRQAQTL